MTRAPAPFPLERLADIPERPEDFRLLERIPLTREESAPDAIAQGMLPLLPAQAVVAA